MKLEKKNKAEIIIATALLITILNTKKSTLVQDIEDTMYKICGVTLLLAPFVGYYLTVKFAGKPQERKNQSYLLENGYALPIEEVTKNAKPVNLKLVDLDDKKSLTKKNNKMLL